EELVVAVAPPADDDETRAPGLQGRDAERLTPRGRAEDVGLVVLPEQFVGGLATAEPHDSVEVPLTDHRLEAGPVGTLAEDVGGVGPSREGDDLIGERPSTHTLT